MSAVGKNLPHDSAKGHVSGESIYIDDMPPAAGELLVDFYFSPVAHGRIKSLDVSEAAKINGVAGIFTAKDIDGENLFGPIFKDEVLLVEEICEFIGHPIAVIAADNRAALKAAKQAINCDIEELEPILSIDQARQQQSFLGPVRRIKRGDVKQALAKADHVLTGTFRNAGQDHFYLESQAAIAFPGEHGQITVHSSTQNPSEVQEVVAHILGLQLNQVVCITKRMGGGFGGKECQATHPAAMACLVAHKLKRPARIVFNKDDDMQVTGKRHPFQNDYKIAFTKEGRITALEVHLFADGGAANDLSPAVLARAMTHIDNAYYIEHADITGTVCKTNTPPNTAFRGFGGPQGIATIESIIQDMAVFLKKDAADIRKINLYGSDDRNTTPYGEIVFNNTLPQVFEEVMRTSDYAKRQRQIDEFNRTSKTHLKGLALTMVKFGISFNTPFLNQANALVNIYLDGSIQVSTGATEMGQGVNTNIAQIVAGEFDIAPHLVIVMPTSTEKNNNTSATAASSATDLNGSAAVIACDKIKDALRVCAANYLAGQSSDTTASPTSIVFRDGFVFDQRRPEKKLTWKEMVKIAYQHRVSLGERGYYATKGLDWSWETGADKTGSGHPFLYYTNGAAVAEVLIDRFTGDLKVSQADLLLDIGSPINPGIARGQIIGAFIQGMGWVTTEELKYADNGWLLSHSPTTYKIPNIQDSPDVFNVNWLDVENKVNIKGSKAVGEPPLVLGLSVWAAVKHALSFVCPDGQIPELNLPATNEEILHRLTQYAQVRKPRPPKAEAAAKKKAALTS